MPSSTLNISQEGASAPFGSTINKGLQSGTRIEFDIPELISYEATWSVYRASNQIAPYAASRKGADCYVAQNMRYWKSGAWTLRPIQDNFAATYELPPDNILPQDFIIGPPSLGKIIKLIAIYGINTIHAAMWGAPVGVGIVPGTGVATKGDPFSRKAIVAGDSWASSATLFPSSPQSFSAPGLITGTSQFQSEHYPMDTWYYTQQNQDEDQGFFLRWQFPGTNTSTPDNLFNFYFGQYCLCASGSGIATLCEWAQPKNGGGYRWVIRDTFRYCRNGSAIGNAHTLTIFPHRGLRGEKFICFSGNDIDVAQSGVGGLLTGGSQGKQIITDEFLYQASPITRNQDIDPRLIVLQNLRMRD